MNKICHFDKLRVLSIYKNNRRNSSNFKDCSSLQLPRNLTERSCAICYYTLVILTGMEKFKEKDVQNQMKIQVKRNNIK